MSEKITIKWQVEDGYVGKERPQTTTLHPEDFLPEMTDGEIGEHIAAMIQEDFEQRITIGWPDEAMNEAIKKIRAVIGRGDEP